MRSLVNWLVEVSMRASFEELVLLIQDFQNLDGVLKFFDVYQLGTSERKLWILVTFKTFDYSFS